MNHSFSQFERYKLPENGSEEGIDLRAISLTILRGKWIIASCMALVVLAGGYYAYGVATPRYQSTSVVMLEAREEQVIDLESVVSGLSADSTIVNSEVEVMRSRSLLGKVVDQLDLVSDREYNPRLQPPSIRAKLSNFVRSHFGGEAEVAEPPRDLTSTRDGVINTLKSSISIRNIPNTLVFEISALSTQPEKAALVANTMAEQYVLNQLEVKFEATEQATNWLTDRVTSLQSELERAEASLQDFRSGTELVSPEALAGLERQLKDVRSRIEGAENSQAQINNLLTSLEVAETWTDKAELLSDPQLARMLQQIDDPAMQQAFNSRVELLVRQRQADLLRLQAQHAALETSAEELAISIERQNADLIEQQQLVRESEASRLLYEYFLTRLKETSAQRGIQQADSRILSSAVVPGFPTSPRKSMILMLSLVLGGIIGVTLVILRELGQNSFRTARDLETFTGYPVMGQIPKLALRQRRDVVRHLIEEPTSAAAEAVRNLRTSLLLSNIDAPPQVIGVSSSVPGEGKTTISFSLAHNLASMGKKTLLIEGDIRRRIFSAYIGMDKEQHGLVAVLSGECALHEAVVKDERTGAEILIGESSHVNAADLFSSNSFLHLLEEARKQYDVVIIDTPPVLVVPDARIIAPHVDAMIFAVAWDRTKKPQVSESLNMFESISHPVKGIVLNQISPRGMKRYGYGGRYGAYGAYSTYGKKYYTS